VAPKPAVPGNLVPTVARKTVAPRNKSAPKVKPAGLLLAGSEANQLNKIIKQDVKTLQSDASKAGLAKQDVAKETMDKAKKLGATPDELNTLDAALKDGDEDAIVQIFKDRGMSESDAEVVADKVRASQALDDYADRLKSGASGGTLQMAQQNAQSALDDLAESNSLSSKPDTKLTSGLPSLNSKVEDLSTLTTARDSINTNPGGPGTLDWTLGTLMVINDPRVPSGALYCAGPNTVIMGVGNSGQFDVRSGTPYDLGIPIITSDPVPGADGSPDVSADSRIILTNPESNGNPVSFILDGQFTYTMEAGHQQKLSTSKSWMIEFNRGSKLGSVRYKLVEGTYEFTVSEQGWNLRSKQYTVQLDNSANPNDFSFVMNNKVEVVKARSTRTLTSSTSVALDFDQGDGGQPAHKELDSGLYRIGVDPGNNKLDLFPGPDAKGAAGSVGN
jgi:hypothetical protein